MHTNIELILTLTGSLAAALVCGYAMLRMGLSPIVGYLLAGVLVGPYTPGFVANKGLADQLAEIGVVLLMFGVGLQFHVEDLFAVARLAVPGALIRSLIAAALGTGIGLLTGWSLAEAAVFGLALSVASTVVLMRVLGDNSALHTPPGKIAVGWLVVEDIFTIVVLVLLPAVASPTGTTGGLLIAMVVALAKVSAMVALTFLMGKLLIPSILNRAAETRSREIFTLTVLVLALGIAVGAVALFGVSMALGAFLAGLVVGRTEFSLRAATEALPMRDAFAVLFFISVGILFHPAFIFENVGLVVMTLIVVLLAKPLVAAVLIVGFKYPLRTALSVSLATAQIGEFSFILASAGERLGVMSPDATGALVVAAIVSISLAPTLYRLVEPLERFLSGKSKRQGGALTQEVIADITSQTPELGQRYRALVVGYGPVGQTLARLLSENEIDPVILELNIDTVRRLSDKGWVALYGDAAHPETLKRAGIENSVALIVSSSSVEGVTEMIRYAREMNPYIVIFVRSAYIREGEALRKAGADVVFSGEGEVAMAMTEYLLRQLGASAEHVERQRERLRAALHRGMHDRGLISTSEARNEKLRSDADGGNAPVGEG